MKKHYDKLNSLNAELQILSEYDRTKDVNNRMIDLLKSITTRTELMLFDCLWFNTNSGELEKEGASVTGNEQSCS